MHPDIIFHFYAENAQLYIHMSHKNAALSFDKLNSCVLDVHKWMLLSIHKLNPDKNGLSSLDLMLNSRN